jgi:hypothetical protein
VLQYVGANHCSKQQQTLLTLDLDVLMQDLQFAAFLWG